MAVSINKAALKYRARTHGLTMKALAAQVGVSRQSLEMWCKGERIPTLDHARALGRAVHLDQWWDLFNLEEGRDGSISGGDE